MNLTALRESFVRAIPLHSDQFESIQRELSKIIEEQQAKGNNGIVKTKYLTFGIDADKFVRKTIQQGAHQRDHGWH